MLNIKWQEIQSWALAVFYERRKRRRWWPLRRIASNQLWKQTKDKNYFSLCLMNYVHVLQLTNKIIWKMKKMMLALSGPPTASFEEAEISAGQVGPPAAIVLIVLIVLAFFFFGSVFYKKKHSVVICLGISRNPRWRVWQGLPSGINIEC